LERVLNCLILFACVLAHGEWCAFGEPPRVHAPIVHQTETKPQSENKAEDEPQYVSYAAVHAAAMRSGGYEPGRRVIIAVAQDQQTNKKYQRHCALKGWTFCVQKMPGALPAGIHDCTAGEDGKLYQTKALRERSAASEEPAMSYQLPKRVKQVTVPIIEQPIYYLSPEYYQPPPTYQQIGGYCFGGGCMSCGS
jgi:hypothetical protein